MSDIHDYYADLMDRVRIDAEAYGQLAQQAFFGIVTENMVESGELDEPHWACFMQRGYQADGWSGNARDSAGAFTLLLNDFSQDDEPRNLTATELEALFKRGLNFLDAIVAGDLVDRLDPGSEVFDLVDTLKTHWSETRKVRLCVLSNRPLSSRVDGKDAGVFRGRELVHSVWDLNRNRQFESSLLDREPLVVRLVDDFGGEVPVLPAHLPDASYKGYLAVMPGLQLAKIYDRWGARLLEQNVRVFLQARGGVNKGIKSTIENEPHMFFAYNNGVSATADKVRFENRGDSLVITEIENLQIVNGGQTTASLHAAMVSKTRTLDDVFVQVKLSVVEPAEAGVVVPNISRYANSQNKISAADFFSNHPYHVRVEEFSRRLVAPAVQGSFAGSKWFYERARGQYSEARSKALGSLKKKFDQEYPRAQVITKTDWAKYLMTWAQHPDLVSKGAQANFAEFARRIAERWEKAEATFNENHFKEGVGAAIVFRRLEKLVPRQSWYAGGYRANIVAYACARLAYQADQLGAAVDFLKVWQLQAVPVGLEAALLVAAEAAMEMLTTPPQGIVNVTEWAKRSGAWERMKAVPLNLPKNWAADLISLDEKKQQDKAGKSTQVLVNTVKDEIAVVSAGADYWRRVEMWGDANQMLSASERDILKVARKIPNVLPSEKQSAVLVRLVKRLVKEGFKEPLPNPTD